MAKARLAGKLDPLQADHQQQNQGCDTNPAKDYGQYRQFTHRHRVEEERASPDECQQQQHTPFESVHLAIDSGGRHAGDQLCAPDHSEPICLSSAVLCPAVFMRLAMMDQQYFSGPSHCASE